MSCKLLLLYVLSSGRVGSLEFKKSEKRSVQNMQKLKSHKLTPARYMQQNKNLNEKIN